MEGPRTVQRDAHDPALFGQRLQDRLTNPPHGVGDELDALGLVELMRCTDEAEIALVDEVGQTHPLVLILLGHRHHEPEVAAHELVERRLTPVPDVLRQRYFVVASDQRILTDLAQILIQGSIFRRDSLD